LAGSMGEGDPVATIRVVFHCECLVLLENNGRGSRMNAYTIVLNRQQRFAVMLSILNDRDPGCIVMDELFVFPEAATLFDNSLEFKRVNLTGYGEFQKMSIGTKALAQYTFHAASNSSVMALLTCPGKGFVLFMEKWNILRIHVTPPQYHG
jgi:hypothetical protein